MIKLSQIVIIGEIMLVNVSASMPNVAMMGCEPSRKQPKFVAHFAHTTASIQAAQRLRAEIFSAEYGVHFNHPQGLDIDNFDHFCHYLLTACFASSSGGVRGNSTVNRVITCLLRLSYCAFQMSLYTEV